MTIANLNSQFHRAIEAEETYRLFRLIFSDETLFQIHPHLPRGGDFGDEGAANHTRFCKEYGEKGTHLFVYGKSAFESQRYHFPFRQAREASEAIARQHGLDPAHTYFVRQNPEAIEAGVFHNDVISVGNRNFFIYHEKAFVDAALKWEEIDAFCVTEEMLPLHDAVKSYFFNGQIMTLPNGEDRMLLPKECENLNLAWLPLKVAFTDVSESMHNGGGPACLRLRCVLNAREKGAALPSVFLTEKLYHTLVAWVEKHFRDQLAPADLIDPSLLTKSKEALDHLSQILQLGSFYEFQR